MTPQIRREVVYKHVVQDIIIPIDELSRSIDLFHEWFEVRKGRVVLTCRVCVIRRPFMSCLTHMGSPVSPYHNPNRCTRS